MSSDDVVSVRQRSRVAALDFIRRTGGCSRTELMEALGLSRGGVAHLVSAMLESGEIELALDEPQSGGRRGRPASILVYKSPSSLVAGIDFGHTHVTAALADLAGNILGETTVTHLVNDDAPGAAAQAKTMLDALVADHGQERPLVGIVAGLPISVDRETGAMRAPARKSSWALRSPKEIVEEAFGTNVSIAHDTNLGALGELRSGAARSLRDALYVKVSAGIGAGLILDGKIYEGSSGFAGEIGHLKVPGSSELCRCGNRGCLESLVGIAPVQRQLELATSPKLDASGQIIFDSDDPVAERILTEAGWTMGRLIADLCAALDPGTVILGGRLGAASVTLRKGVQAALLRFAEPAIATSLRVVAAELGARAEIVGAVAQAVDEAVSRTRA